jgi:hypothetical protein
MAPKVASSGVSFTFRLKTWTALPLEESLDRKSGCRVGQNVYRLAYKSTIQVVLRTFYYFVKNVILERHNNIKFISMLLKLLRSQFYVLVSGKHRQETAFTVANETSTLSARELTPENSKQGK